MHYRLVICIVALTSLTAWKQTCIGTFAMQTSAVEGAAAVAGQAAAKQQQQEQQQQQTRRLKPARARSQVPACVRVMGGDSSSLGPGVQPEAVGGCDREHVGGAGSSSGGPSHSSGSVLASGIHSEKGADGWRAEGAGVQHGQDCKKSPRGGGGGHAGGDGQEQAGGAGPFLPVGPEKFEFAGKALWQAYLGGGTWQDVDPTWSEPLFQTLRDGVPAICLPHVYHNRQGDKVKSWYTIEFRGGKFTQRNEATGTVRDLRAIQAKTLKVVQPTQPPPSQFAVLPLLEHPAAPASPPDRMAGGDCGPQPEVSPSAPSQ